MSEIRFKNLQIENFLSIGEGSLNLDERGLLLIQGVNDDDPSTNSNGAGKSSIVDSLCWALYGTTARGKTGDGVVNRFEGKNCRVQVDFTLNGKSYTVIRHRKHSKGKNRLHFECDGGDLTLGTDKLTQDLVERTIGCNLQVFTASIYAGQNSMPNLPAMTDKELKLLVEKAAGIELLDLAYDIARERSRIITSARDAAAACNKYACNSLDNRKYQLELHGKNLDQWNDEQAKRIRDSSDALRLQATSARKLKEELDAVDESAIDDRIADVERKLVEVNKPLPELIAPTPPSIEPHPATPSELTDAKMRLSLLENRIETRKSEIRTRLTEVAGLDAVVGTPCGECGKPYHKTDLEARRNILTAKLRNDKVQIEREQAELLELTATWQELHDEHVQRCSELDAQNAQRQSEYKGAQERYQKALSERRATIASSDSAKLMETLKSAQNERQTLTNKRHSLASQLDALRREREQLEKLKSAENPHVKSIAIAEKALQEAKAEVEQTAKELSEAEQRVADIAAVVELYSPKGMRGEVLDSVTPFLNARTANYLGALSDGSITAEWKTIGETGKGELREKFHIEVQNTHGSEDFAGLSGGEQRKVQISTAMALQDLVASRADRPIKLFMADEVDDAIDVSGLERLMGVLDDKARNVGTVLVISHNDLADWVSNQVTVMKSGGRSHIVEI